jgi:hypothetical protein
MLFIIYRDFQGNKQIAVLWWLLPQRPVFKIRSLNCYSKPLTLKLTLRIQ